MKVHEVKNQSDETQIDFIEGTLVSLGDRKPGKQAGWASSWLGKLADGNEFASVTFSLKNGNPEQFKGQTIRIKSSRKEDGSLVGVKTKANGQYMNVHVTDAAKIEVIGQVTSESRPAAGPAQRQSAPAAPSNISAEDYAKHLATEWVTVYGWTAPIFETVLKTEQIRECVTGTLIEMRRSGVKILSATDNWRAVQFKGEKLGDFKPERIKGALLKLYRGAKITKEVTDALLAAAKEPEFNPKAVFDFMVNEQGIQDEVRDQVLTKMFTDPSFINEGEYIKLCSTTEFVDECIKLQTATSQLDDSDTIDL